MNPDLQQYIDKAAILVEALPYIQSFRGKTVVVKYGGSTLTGAEAVDTVLKDLVFMELVGINPVIVHGGGPAIDRQLRKQNIETKRVNGLRITDQDTMQIVEGVLFGEVNAGLVAAIEALGGNAVGVSAKDAGILLVRPHVAQTEDGPVELGFVGDVESVDAEPLHKMIAREEIPVVAPIGRGADGAAYNVNADTAAGEIAAAVHAEKLVFLTNVTGIMEDPADESTLMSTVRLGQVDGLIAEGVLQGGMIPKVLAGVHSVKAGVRKTHIIDGRIPHSILLEFFTDEGVGTQVVQ
ncbi:MAG TPA: acetylglutamate kinase [Candidatus Latescibacteria bacterium]|jgi:acetylglutamate kinase|nr:acetylglutamate kinase [Candidatus Latescibacterota bacterium]HJP33140.1 acetylglutamate kinase [Candidatus Latescibacterota bacterium]